MKKKNTEEFIADARKVHGDKYDYSKVEYKSSKEKVCIICPIHGEFWQTPKNHLKGNGCQKCKKIKLQETFSKTREEFITKAIITHGNKYDYRKVKYVNARTKVCIICPIHGEFWQTPNDHLNGKGCKYCSHQSFKYTKDAFIEKARQIHSDKYDYSKVEYINAHTKVCIICPEHGEFWITPHNHLLGQGCNICGKSKKLTKEEFIKKANKIHGEKYDYSKVIYVNNRTKVCIICPIHGEFWQTPNSHLSGRGCTKCHLSKLENEISTILEDNEIKYEINHFYSFLDNLQLDYFIPSKNIAIECQGEQHFHAVDFAGKGKKWAEEEFQKVIERDNRKRKLCEENGIKLLYYSNLHIDYPYKVYENLDEILQIIKEC